MTKRPKKRTISKKAWRKLPPADQLRELIVAVDLMLVQTRSNFMLVNTWIERSLEGLSERIAEVEQRLRADK